MGLLSGLFKGAIAKKLLTRLTGRGGSNPRTTRR